MDDCIFCKIIAKRKPADILFEDEDTLVMLDIDDVVKGHLLVVWKHHVLNSSDLTENDYLHFSKIFRLAEKTILKLLQKERALVLKTGGLVSHFHFHIYPVDKETSWDEIKAMFDKKIEYPYQIGEKEQLLDDMRRELLIK